MVVTDEKECLAGMKTASSLSTTSSNSTMSSSLRRVCRICQSERGRLVRPCGCSGTMADVHEHCLNAWIVASRNDEGCEICRQPYAVDGTRMLPVWKWSQPTFTFKAVIEWLLLATLIYDYWYLVTLLDERYTYDRLIVDALPFRLNDIARFAVLTLVLLCLGLSMFSQISKAVVYISRQTTRRYVDADYPRV